MSLDIRHYTNGQKSIIKYKDGSFYTEYKQLFEQTYEAVEQCTYPVTTMMHCAITENICYQMSADKVK